MNPHDLLEQIITAARKLGVESTAAGFTRNQERMVRFSNNSITVTNSWLTESPTIYLISNRKRAACRIEEQNPADLKDVIEELVKTMLLSTTNEGDLVLDPSRGDLVSFTLTLPVAS